MMARLSLFSINARDVERVAARLDAAQAIGDSTEVLRTLNDYVDEVYETARGRMVKGVNLTEAYIESKMAVEHATPERGLQASIVAFGGGAFQTPLGRYFHSQGQADTRWTNSDVLAHGGGTDTAWPGWTWRKGDARRGIPAGQKAAGVAVEVRRGQIKTLPHGFTMPLRRGNESGGNGMGVFTRDKRGDLVRHRYGPAVYQLFRAAAGDIVDDVSRGLEQRVVDVAEAALQKALGS